MLFIFGLFQKPTSEVHDIVTLTLPLSKFVAIYLKGIKMLGEKELILTLLDNFFKVWSGIHKRPMMCKEICPNRGVVGKVWHAPLV